MKERKKENYLMMILHHQQSPFGIKKIFIIVGIISFIIIAIAITIMVSKFSSSSSSSSEQNNQNNSNKQKQDSDSKDKEDSQKTEIDSCINLLFFENNNEKYKRVKQDCIGVCSKPFNNLVYNDKVLKDKLKE